MVTGAYDPASGTCFTISLHDERTADDESKNLWMVAALPFVHDSAMIEPRKLHEPGKSKRRSNYAFHFGSCRGRVHTFPEFLNIGMPDRSVELRQQIL